MIGHCFIKLSHDRLIFKYISDSSKVGIALSNYYMNAYISKPFSSKWALSNISPLQRSEFHLNGLI